MVGHQPFLESANDAGKAVSLDARDFNPI